MNFYNYSPKNILNDASEALKIFIGANLFSIDLKKKSQEPT